MTSRYSADEKVADLQALSARLTRHGTYMYTLDEAEEEIRSRIAGVQRLEECHTAVAHLIRLAIGHGVSPAALDRLNDALDELEPSSIDQNPAAHDHVVTAGGSRLGDRDDGHK
jgi:hypothetical protein